MKSKKLILALATLALPVMLFAADVKVAVIDLEQVFNKYYKTKISAANLKKQADVFKAYAKKLDASRLKLMEEFKALRDESQNIALSKVEQDNKRIKAQQKYRAVKEKEAELSQYNRSKYQQLKVERAKMREALLKEIKREIAKRSALAGYTLVLDKSGKSLSNISIVVYNNPSIDITDTIVKELNRGYNKK